MSTITKSKHVVRSPRVTMLSRIVPQLDPRVRLAAMRRIFGMWKHRAPDPINEQRKIRKEWDRALPKR